MRKHKSDLLFMQDDQNATVHRRKSKANARKSVFRIAFRALETTAMVVSIIECVLSIFKK